MSDTIYQYETKKYPLLTKEQQLGLDLTGEEKVPDGSSLLTFYQWRLVTHNLRLVFFVMQKLHLTTPGMDFLDSIQEGNLGLIRAAQLYDSAKGATFSTYAYNWIFQGLYRSMYTNYNIIRWPIHIAPELIRRAYKGDDSGLENGHKRVWHIGNRGIEVKDPADSPADTDNALDCKRLLSLLKKDRHKDILIRRFGLHGQEPETLETIGQSMGITRERVRQIADKALEILQELNLEKEQEGATKARALERNPVLEMKEFMRAKRQRAALLHKKLRRRNIERFLKKIEARAIKEAKLTRPQLLKVYRLAQERGVV